MFYLINCNTHGCVDFSSIVGIATNSRGVQELLFNYHKYHSIIYSEITFEETLFDIEIFKINEKNYNYLKKKIDDKIEEIYEMHEKNNFNPEKQCSDFLFVILNNDLPQYDIFTKDFHKKYNNIIKKSKKLII